MTVASAARLQIRNIKIGRHPAPNGAGALADVVKFLITGPVRRRRPADQRFCHPDPRDRLAARRNLVFHSSTFRYIFSAAVPSLAGDLDYETTDDLVDVATRLLAQQNNLNDLHLDFSELSFLDSAALSGLLIMNRRASQAGVAFRLDHRPPFLDRVLQVTGLFNHFDLTRTDAETGDPICWVRPGRTGQALADFNT